MKITIDQIESIAIRNAMKKDRFTSAEFIGAYEHPEHHGESDWIVRLYYAAEQLVFTTNGDAVWACSPEFDGIVKEYGINIDSAVARI